MPVALSPGGPSVRLRAVLCLSPIVELLPLLFPQSSSRSWALGLLLREEVVLTSFFVPALERVRSPDGPDLEICQTEVASRGPKLSFM